MPEDPSKSKINPDDLLQAAIRSQQTDQTPGNIKYMRIFGIVFFLAIIGVVAFMILNTSNVITSNGQNKVSGEFSPDAYLNKKRVITGRIFKLSDVSEDSEYKHEILGGDNRRVAYVYSNDNDLDLSVGLQVEIGGEMVYKSGDGYEVVLIESLELK